MQSCIRILKPRNIHTSWDKIPVIQSVAHYFANWVILVHNCINRKTCIYILLRTEKGGNIDSSAESYITGSHIPLTYEVSCVHSRRYPRGGLHPLR